MKHSSLSYEDRKSVAEALYKAGFNPEFSSFYGDIIAGYSVAGYCDSVEYFLYPLDVDQYTMEVILNDN